MQFVLTESPCDAVGSLLDPLTWCLHPLVMVGVDAHLVLFQVKGILAGLHGPQLVVAVQVWPSPQATVEDMGEALPMGHLQTAIQGPAIGAVVNCGKVAMV